MRAQSRGSFLQLLEFNNLAVYIARCELIRYAERRLYKIVLSIVNVIVVYIIAGAAASGFDPDLIIRNLHADGELVIWNCLTWQVLICEHYAWQRISKSTRLQQLLTRVVSRLYSCKFVFTLVDVEYSKCASNS